MISGPARLSSFAVGAALAFIAPLVAAQGLKWKGDAVPPSVQTVPAIPQTPPQRSGDYLSRMDVDRDSKVSLLEYQNWLSYAFDGMDRNRDGTLTADEQPGDRGQTLTRDAHRMRLAERFRRQDLDRSGFLDAKELAAPPQGR